MRQFLGWVCGFDAVNARVILQVSWVGLRISSAIFKISSCPTVTRPFFSTMTQPFSDFVMPYYSNLVIL
jgi:hypothetical protein